MGERERGWRMNKERRRERGERERGGERERKKVSRGVENKQNRKE